MNKLILLIFSATFSTVALSSGFESTGKPARIHCHGPKGELTLEADEQQKSFKLEIIVGNTTNLIVIDEIKAREFQAQPKVSVTAFTYEDPNRNFVSIDAMFVKPRWIPPTNFCQPSRAPVPCSPVHHDGYWGTISSHEVLIGFKLNPTDPNSYFLDVLRAEPYGVGGIDEKPLGENVECRGQLI